MFKCGQRTSIGRRRREKSLTRLRSAFRFGVMGLLCAAIASSAFSRAEAGKIETPIAAATSGLHGVVLTTNGEPIANAAITIKGVLAGRGAVYVFDAKDCNRQAMTKTDGSFKFDGLVAETKFQGIVAAPGFELGQFWDADPSKPLEIKLLPAPTADDPQHTVRGRVINDDGKPIYGAKIQVHGIHTQDYWFSVGGLVFTDKDGDFIIRKKEDFIDCDFSIEANGYESRIYSKVHPAATTAEYQLSQGTTLTGRLVKDAKPVPDAGVGIYGVAGGFMNNFSAVTDTNGRFTFSGVPANQEYYLFGIMKSLRDLGALPRQHVKTGAEGTHLDVGDLNLAKGYTISGRLQMKNGKPAHAASFSLARTELTPKPGHTPTAREEGNRWFYGLENSFDSWRIFPGEDGKFEFTGVPGETVSINMMLKPFNMVSPRNVSSDGKGFRLLGLVVSNKTDLIIELEPHSGQVFPPARDYEALTHQPLQGAEAAIAK